MQATMEELSNGRAAPAWGLPAIGVPELPGKVVCLPLGQACLLLLQLDQTGSQGAAAVLLADPFAH